MRHFIPLAMLGIFVAACGTDSKLALSLESENGQSCNPVSMGECLLPIPSSAWQKSDKSTPTGYRLALPGKLLPSKPNKRGVPIPLDPAPYNEADGWSPGTSIMVHFKEEISDVNLVPHEHIEASLEAASPTVVLDAETGERVAHWVELDQNDQIAAKRGDEPSYRDKGLLIRPASDLKRSHRYIVAITTALQTKSGAKLTSPRAFNALRDNVETDNDAVERLRPRYRSLFTKLAAAGVARGELLTAWDFDTASDESIHRDILAMRAQALTALGETGIGYKITSTEFIDNGTVLEVHGTYQSPLFLAAGGDSYKSITACKGEVAGDCKAVGYVRDAAGLPVQQGVWNRPFIMTIPKAAVTTATLPVIQFGHGLLGGADEITSGYNRGFAKDYKIVFVAGNWTGLCAEDVPVVSAGLLNWNLFPITTFRLGQGHIDGIALSYTIRRMQDDAQIKATLGISHNPIQADGMTYYGISLGGIMGGGFMALHPFIKYGVLNVPGSTWSLMMQRSSNWNSYGAILATGYPSYMDQQIVLTLAQALFDISDPIAFAPHLISNPFPGTPAKNILFQEAVGDSQVPNVSTEKMARATGVKLISPSVRKVYGLEEATEATSALTAWDQKVAAVPPRVNLPPPEDNHTHGEIRKLTALKTQIMRFFYGDHKIVNTCDGVCDPE